MSLVEEYDGFLADDGQPRTHRFSGIGMHLRKEVIGGEAWLAYEIGDSEGRVRFGSPEMAELRSCIDNIDRNLQRILELKLPGGADG